MSKVKQLDEKVAAEVLEALRTEEISIHKACSGDANRPRNSGTTCVCFELNAAFVKKAECWSRNISVNCCRSPLIRIP